MVFSDAHLAITPRHRPEGYLSAQLSHCSKSAIIINRKVKLVAIVLLAGQRLSFTRPRCADGYESAAAVVE